MAGKSYISYIGIPSSTNAKRFTILSYYWDGSVYWEMESIFDGELLGLSLNSDGSKLLVVASRQSDSKVIASRILAANGNILRT